MDEKKTEQKATFIIKVLYRQNATWQGTVHWVEKNLDRPFRSEMELLKLMNSAGDKKWEEILSGGAESPAAPENSACPKG
jgi:hypothetical protein